MRTKYYLIVITALLLGISNTAKSDEGMWLPFLVKRLNYENMQKMGLKLTPEEIYSINQSSIKDAIIQMDDVSTGTLISPDGLVMASHSFGFNYIQANSTLKNDYISDGFWAKSKKEELSNPGLMVRFLVRVEDVTNKILPKLKDDMSEQERQARINELSEKLQVKAIGKTHFEAVVKSFFNGNEFYLFVYEVFKDVRLVGAPPQSIGNYGGDTDNWQWPRHTADFSMFRIYTGSDGKPAEYSEDNIPYKSKYYLPISLKGVKENDFTMVLGYPIKTARYTSSFGVDQALRKTNPLLIKVKEEKLNVLKNSMRDNDPIRIKYASKYARTSNIWKYYLGLSKQLRRFDVINKKAKEEEEFRRWVEQSAHRKAKYGNVINDIEEVYDKLNGYDVFLNYFYEIVIDGPELMTLAFNFYPVYKELQGLNRKDLKSYQIPEGLKTKVKNYTKDIHFPTDRKIFTKLLGMVEYEITKDQRPDIFSTTKLEYNDKFKWFANDVYRSSLFADVSLLWDFINNPDPKVLENDLGFKFIISFVEKSNEIQKKVENYQNQLAKARRLYVEGMKELNKDDVYYPDANSTMRLTYGKIAGYTPMDGLIGKYYTTFYGVMEKEDPINEDYIFPDKLKDLYATKDYGQYASNSSLHVNFITTNDVTGGSSGSAVINGNGEVVGFTFDKNWEGMSGDITFEENYQRTINVDVRYILFIIEKYAGAKHLIDEMKLVKN